MLNMFNNKTDFEDADCSIVVLPIGALEQHGSHLPVGTDNIIATELAERIALKLNAYLLPTLPITCSIEHRLTKGTVYLKASTLASMIRDIAESLQFSGFKKLYLLNIHGGNWVVKPTVRELNRELPDIHVILISMKTAQSAIQKLKKSGQSADVHAGEFETSIMMHLNKEYVGKINDCKEQEFCPQDYLDYFDISEITEDGYWGYPEYATAETGEEIINLLVQAALKDIQQIEDTRIKISTK